MQAPAAGSTARAAEKLDVCSGPRGSCAVETLAPTLQALGLMYNISAPGATCLPVFLLGCCSQSCVSLWAWVALV